MVKRRYAAPGTRFQLPFVPLGIVPEAASSLLLPMVAGYQRAAELLLLGQPFDAARAVGKLLAERAVKNGVTEVVFDRGGYLYHGRVKALADAARESGLSF